MATRPWLHCNMEHIYLTEHFRQTPLQGTLRDKYWPCRPIIKYLALLYIPRIGQVNAICLVTLLSILELYF